MSYESQLLEATNLLSREPHLRKLSGTALVAGDIHGDLESLKRIIRIREDLDLDNLILLGDYVDRGTHQIEVVETIAKQILSDSKFTPLRGNHEDSKTCTKYGFFSELEKRKLSFDISMDFFAQLPMAAISECIFLSHGGIPIEHNFLISQINSDRDNFPREWQLKKGPQFQIGWNDPLYDGSETVKKFIVSKRGSSCFEWGKEITHQFLNTNNLELIIRAHIAFSEGFQWIHNKSVLSLFSSSSGPYRKHSRKVAKLDINEPETIEILEI